MNADATLNLPADAPANGTGSNGATYPDVRCANSSPAGMMPAIVLPPAPPKGRGIKPLVSIYQHKFVALGVLAMMTLIAVPGMMVLGKHYFYTEAVFLVSPHFVKNLTTDKELELQSNTQYREYVQQQVRTVNRYDIVFAGLQKLGDKRWFWQGKGETDRSAAERLAGNLQVKPVPDTYMVTIGLESTKKEGLADVLNAVMEAYVSKSKAEEFYDSGERIQNLKEERGKVLQDIQAESDRRTAIAQLLGVTTFNQSMLNPYDQLLIKTKEALDTARRNRIEVEASLLALEQKEVDGQSAVDAYAQESVDKDAALNGLKINFNVRRAALLQKLSGMAPEHPGRQAIEKELADAETDIQKATGILLEKFRLMLLTQKRSLALQARQIEKDLTLEVEAESARAQQYATLYNEALGNEIDLDRNRKRVNTINDRIDYLALETNAPGFVRIITPAREPLAPSKSGHKRSFIMIFLLGCVLAAIVPVAIDFIDPRIHVPGELQKLAGFAPLAAIFDKNQAGVNAMARDQLQRFAASLERDARSNGTRVFVMTSPKAAEGTTTLALDLGHMLGELGVSAIVVEANRDKPDTRYSDDPRRPGLTAALDGIATLTEVITPAAGELPDRIAVGSLEGRTHISSMEAIDSLFRELARLYTIVLVDTAPLLLSAETEMIVGLGHAALLVVQAAGITKGEIKRAVSTLERLSPPVVGTVLTRMKVFKGGGYMASTLREQKLISRLKSNRLTAPWLWK